MTNIIQRLADAISGDVHSQLEEANAKIARLQLTAERANTERADAVNELKGFRAQENAIRASARTATAQALLRSFDDKQALPPVHIVGDATAEEVHNRIRALKTELDAVKVKLESSLSAHAISQTNLKNAIAQRDEHKSALDGAMAAAEKAKQELAAKTKVPAKTSVGTPKKTSALTRAAKNATKSGSLKPKKVATASVSAPKAKRPSTAW